MTLFITIKKATLFYAAVVILLIGLLMISAFLFINDASLTFSEDQVLPILHQIFYTRNKAMIDEDVESLKALYDTDKKYGTWAYEHEIKKMKYLHQWSNKQGITFTNIDSDVMVRSVKEKNSGITVNLIVSTEYKYKYQNEPEANNYFRIGTYHSMDLMLDTKEILENQQHTNEQMTLALNQDTWCITREWYTDPFADSLDLDTVNTEEVKEYILSHAPRDFSQINPRRISAVEYADQYCGAADNGKNGYQYNKKYKDYNPLGGDCANFASQILYEGAKFKKTHGWNYSKGGSKAWVNAHAFKDYMLYSGRASRIAYGTYNQVFKASFKLLPGDFIAYEKKGKVTHISVVTGADSKGYTLVNCHNTDRYRVPWDLGWSNKGIKFWLVRVHY